MKQQQRNGLFVSGRRTCNLLFCVVAFHSTILCLEDVGADVVWVSLINESGLAQIVYQWNVGSVTLPLGQGLADYLCITFTNRNNSMRTELVRAPFSPNVSAH